jgi:hypothetical protein
LVGAPGFELGTPCTPCKCATRLRHAPTTAQLYLKSLLGLTPQHFDDAQKLDAQLLGSQGRRVGCRLHGIVQAVARATDGKTLAVEKFANAANQQNFMVLVVATVAATLSPV